MRHKNDLYEHPGPMYALDPWILVQPVCAKMTLVGCVIVSFSAQLLDRETNLDQLRDLCYEEKRQLRSWAVDYLLASPLRIKMGADPTHYFDEVRKSTSSDKVVGYHVILLTPRLDLLALVEGIGDIYDA